ncbi:hypothetical protein NO371_09630 [Escherichia coli]|nr:hypothetical protein [Escherichia coli]
MTIIYFLSPTGIDITKKMSGTLFATFKGFILGVFVNNELQ